MENATAAISQPVQEDAKVQTKKMPVAVEIMEGITFAVILLTVSVLYAQTLRVAFGIY